MAQQTLNRPDGDERSKIDRDYDREFNAAVENNTRPGTHEREQDTQNTNNTANNLSNQESSTTTPDYDKSVADREKDNAGGAWKNNVSGREKEESGSKGKKRSRFGLGNMKGLAKRFGPTGIVGTVLVGGIGGLTFTAGPASLLVNLKENFVQNHDQQSVTAEVRSRKLLNKRLVSKTTSGICSKVKLACRYQKPSDRLLKRLNAEGIKALDANGVEIEKQGFLTGKTRPDSFQLKDGKKVQASDFMDTLKKDPEFRRAFRRAHSPRWMNWFDDTAIKFLNKRKISKKPPDDIKNAKNADELEDATKKAMTTADEGQDAISKSVQEAGDDFAKKEGKKAAKRSHGDAILATAQGACIAAKVPIVVNKVLRTFRIAQLTAMAFTVLSVADKIKKGEAEPQEVSNVASLLTQTYKMSNGTVKRSAMDSGAMKYGLGLGTEGADSKFLPTIGSAFAAYTQIATSGVVEGVCAAVGSTEAQIAVDVLKAAKTTNPAGWAALIVDGVVAVIEAAGWLDDAITSIVSTGVQLFTDHVDWKKLLEYFLGNFAASARGIDLGDVVSIGSILNFGDLANAGGNLPLTPAQKTAFDEQIKNPVKLAWAQEDRLDHSPFDASNPNTFLGSIVTQLLPYQSSISNPIKTISSIASISTSALERFLIPASHATEIKGNMCKADQLVAQSGVSSGPLCDVQYGIPTEYMGIEPDTVLDELHDAGEIDDEGNPKSDSDLSDWMSSCNADGDTLSLSSCTVNSRKEALYGLYQIDKRQADGMDNDPDKTGASSSSSSSGSSSGSTSLPEGSAQELAKQILDNQNITLPDPSEGYDFDPYQQMKDTADGKDAKPAALQPRLLQVLLALAKNHTFKITALGRDDSVSYSHCSTAPYSTHCIGEAVDLINIDGGSTTGDDSASVSVLKDILDNKLLPQGAGIGQSGCGSAERADIDNKLEAAGYIPHSDGCHHLHLALRRNNKAPKTW